MYRDFFTSGFHICRDRLKLPVEPSSSPSPSHCVVTCVASQRQGEAQQSPTPPSAAPQRSSSKPAASHAARHSQARGAPRQLPTVALPDAGNGMELHLRQSSASGSEQLPGLQGSLELPAIRPVAGSAQAGPRPQAQVEVAIQGQGHNANTSAASVGEGQQCQGAGAGRAYFHLIGCRCQAVNLIGLGLPPHGRPRVGARHSVRRVVGRRSAFAAAAYAAL